jgi:hypothetical protein
MGAKLSKVNKWSGELHNLEEVLYEDGTCQYTMTLNMLIAYPEDNNLTSSEQRELNVECLTKMFIDAVNHVRDHTAEQIVSKLDSNYDDMAVDGK